MIPAIKASANRVVNYPGNLQAHEKFHQRCEMTLKCVAKIQKAFSGQTELELLNPLRHRAREKIGENMYCVIYGWKILLNWTSAMCIAFQFQLRTCGYLKTSNKNSFKITIKLRKYEVKQLLYNYFQLMQMKKNVLNLTLRRVTRIHQLLLNRFITKWLIAWPNSRKKLL